MGSNIDTVKSYFTRMYETEEGSAEEIVQDVFAPDLVYHLGEGESAGRDAFIKLVSTMRSVPSEDREVASLRIHRGGRRGHVPYVHQGAAPQDR